MQDISRIAGIFPHCGTFSCMLDIFRHCWDIFPHCETLSHIAGHIPALLGIFPHCRTFSHLLDIFPHCFMALQDIFQLAGHFPHCWTFSHPAGQFPRIAGQSSALLDHRQVELKGQVSLPSPLSRCRYRLKITFGDRFRLDAANCIRTRTALSSFE